MRELFSVNEGDGIVEMIGMYTPALITAGAVGLTLATTAVVFGVRKLIRVGQYSYHNSRLSTIGNPYVKRDELLPLVDMGSPLALSKAILSELTPGNSIETFRDVDRSLMASFHGSMNSLLDGSPDTIKPLIRSYMSHLEGEELKRLLRLLGHRKEPLFPVGWLTSDVERAILSSKDLPSVMDVLEGQPVSKRVSDLIKVEEGVDLSTVDLAMDLHSLDTLSSMNGLSMGSRKGAKAFLDILSDRYNIHNILRSKAKGSDRDEVIGSLFTNAGIIGRPQLEQMVDSSGIREALSVLSGGHLDPFFKEADISSFTTLETALDRMILEGSIGLSHSYSSNVGPTIRYMISKEMELRNLRVLFQSAFSGWEPERTKKMLVMEGVV